MKIAVVGLGAVGGLFAGWLGSRLPAGSVQVSALARGATLTALRTHGLRLHGGPTVMLHASDDPAVLGPQDLVIVAVKAPALPGAAAAVRTLAGATGTVLVAMNGVPWWFFDGLPPTPQRPAGLRLDCTDPEGRIAAAIDTARVVGCVVHLASESPAPGVVQHTRGDGLILGEPDGRIGARLQRLQALLAQAGFAVTLSERIQRDIWFKLWGNMTMNPVSALTGATCDRILDDPLVRRFCSAVMEETQALGAAIGIPIVQQPEQRHAVTRKLGALRTSMLQDVEAGRPLEVDALLGAVHELGRHLGLATPNVDALLGLLRLMARQRGLLPPAGPGSA